MSATTPVAPPGVFPPPPGITANFIDPPMHSNGLVPLIGVFLTLSTIFLVLRLYTKVFLMRLLGWEDLAITVAWMLNVVFMALYIRGVQLGSTSHIWNFTTDKYPEYARLAAASNLLYSPVTGLPKIAILIFYLRINPSHAFRVSTFIVIGFTFAYIIGILLVQLFACHPIEKLWKPLIPGSCINERPIFLTIPISGTILDILTLCLPIPMLITLHVSVRTKLAVMAIFSVCSCTVVLSALRIWTISELLDTADLNWNAAVSNCLTVAETNLMIVCGSVLVLRPFCRRHLPFVLGGDSHKSSNEMLGFGVNIVPNKLEQSKPSYDGPMGPLSKSQYRAKVRTGTGAGGTHSGRKFPKRTLWGIGFAPSVFTGTDTDDDDLESLSAELKRLPAVGMKRNTYDNVDVTGQVKNHEGTAIPPTTSTIDWPIANMEGDNNRSAPAHVVPGDGHSDARTESRDASASGDPDLENGIVKTVSLDVR